MTELNQRGNLVIRQVGRAYFSLKLMIAVSPQVGRKLENLSRKTVAWLGVAILAWLVATLPLRMVAGAIGAATLGILLLRWPWLIWLGLAIALPVSSGSKIGPLSLTDIGLAAALALWLLDGVRRRTLRLTFSPLVGAVLGYVAALILSLIGALNLGEALAEVVKWIQVALVLLVLRQMMPRQQTHWLVAALLLGGVGQALLGLYQFIFQIGPEWFIILGRFMRASGSFGQPNPYAGYLGLCLPVAASLALWAWQRLWQPVDQSMGQSMAKTATVSFLWWALFYTAATILIGAGLLASWSRGGWMGAAGGLAIVLTLRSRQAMLAGLAGTLLLVVTMLVNSALPQWIPAPIAARLQDIPAYFGMTDVLNQPVTDENFAVIERIAHWVAALRMWEQAPWVGIGPGNYATIYPTVRIPRWEEALGHAHNIYLNTLAESGLIGFGMFLLIWLVAIRWTWRQHMIARRVNADWHDSWRAALAIGLLGVIGHSLVHNFFDNLFVQGIYLQVAFWLAALAVAVPDQTLVIASLNSAGRLSQASKNKESNGQTI